MRIGSALKSVVGQLVEQRAASSGLHALTNGTAHPKPLPLAWLSSRQSSGQAAGMLSTYVSLCQLGTVFPLRLLLMEGHAGPDGVTCLHQDHQDRAQSPNHPQKVPQQLPQWASWAWGLQAQ